MHRFFKHFKLGKAPGRGNKRSVLKARRTLFAESGLFDHKWYLDSYPDIRQSDESPLDHLVAHGAREWRNPGPHFDSAFYAATNPSFEKSGLSPLEHYLRFGRVAGIPCTRLQMCEMSEFGTLLRKSGLLDAQWYLDRYPDVSAAGFTAFEHQVLVGAMEGRDPGPDFDATFYVQRNPDFPDDRSISPLEHYLRFGRAAGIPCTRLQMCEMSEFGTLLRKSGLLDAQWYLDRYPDVSAAGFTAFEHQVLVGAMEGRDPGPDFDAAFYVQRNPDFPDDRSISPLEHYLRFGRAAGIPCTHLQMCEMSEFGMLLRGSGLLDAEWYLKRYTDVRLAGISALAHQVMIGAMEGRDPGPNFDVALYVEESLDFPADGSISPLEHYLRFGKAKDYKALGSPPYERWIRRFDTLTETDRHWIAADAKSRALPGVTCFHIQPPQDGSAEAIAHALDDQIGYPAPPIYLVDRPSLTTAVKVVEGLPEGSIVILVGGNAKLRPQAFYCFVSALMSAGLEVAYSDHDHEDTDGRRTRPVFKPQMSPDFLRNFSYVGPVIALRLTRELQAKLPLVLERALEIDHAAALARLLLDYDRKQITRLPLCLYSVPSCSVKIEAGLDFVYEFVPGTTDDHSIPHIVDLPQVRIVIPTRDRHELLEACISSILEKTDYPRDRYRIIVVDNSSSDPASLEFLRRIEADRFCSVTPSPGPFNFSKICNDGANSTDGEVLVFLNNDITVIDANWLKTLVSYAKDPDIGVVGAKLLYPNDMVQHGGVVLGAQGVGAHRHGGYAVSEVTHLDATREMTAITGACMAVRRAVFEYLGGFDPFLAVAFNDLHLCIRSFEAGYRNIYVAQPLMYHHESMSRGIDDTRAKKTVALREAIYMYSRHGDLLRDDPSYSPNLSLQRIGDLAIPPRYIVPWRRSTTSRHVLILASAFGIGCDVFQMVAMQAKQFRSRGWTVTIGGPASHPEYEYAGCTWVRLVTERRAAAYAVEHGCDCIIAHTMPFYSVARYLGHRPLLYLFDHGEPPPEFFDDHASRDAQIWEKNFCAALARRVFVTSQAIYDEQSRSDTVILNNGNTRFPTWSPAWAERRESLRRKFGFDGRFVVLIAHCFDRAIRPYTDIDLYAGLAEETSSPTFAPSAQVTFVLAGQGDDVEVSDLEKLGIIVLRHIDEQTMIELYAACDLYMSLSKGEGDNLGITQALAMGLPVIASDIPAYREFGVPTANSVPRLRTLVAEALEQWDDTPTARTAWLKRWDASRSRLVDILEKDVEADRANSWL